jgi:phosphonate transport system substrate-binding protein
MVAGMNSPFGVALAKARAQILGWLQATNLGAGFRQHDNFVLVLAGALLLAVPACAVDCPRGALDARYCDSDGDMIADPPADPKELIDPDTLIFAYTPLEDPSVFPEIFKNFLDHLRAATGKKVRMFLVQTNAAQLEALRSGRIHVAGVNTGGVPIAVNCAGFVPFATMASPSGRYGNHMQIIVPTGSAIQTPADLKGRRIAFTSPTSTSGYKAPAYILESEFGLKPEIDYRSEFSGKHENSILGVVNGDYEVAAVASTVMGYLAARGGYDPKAIRVIHRSVTFPTTGYGYGHDLAPALAEKIRAAFLSYSIATDPNMSREFQGQDRFAVMSYKTDWEAIRQIDVATGVTYDCK